MNTYVINVDPTLDVNETKVNSVLTTQAEAYTKYFNNQWLVRSDKSLSHWYGYLEPIFGAKRFFVVEANIVNFTGLPVPGEVETFFTKHIRAA